MLLVSDDVLGVGGKARTNSLGSVATRGIVAVFVACAVVRASVPEALAVMADAYRYMQSLLSLETLEARCGWRLRQVRRAETCLGTFDVVRVADELDLVVGPDVARRWLAVCGSAAPSATGRILNKK